MKRVIAALFTALALTLSVYAAETAADPSDETVTVAESVLMLSGEDRIEGGSFTVSLYAEYDGLRGCTAKISYNAGKLHLVSVTYPEGSPLTSSHTEYDGHVNVVFFSSEALHTSVKAADLTFEVREGEENEIMKVDLSDAVFTDGVTETEPLCVGFEAALAEETHTETTGTDTEYVNTETDSDGNTETDTASGTGGAGDTDMTTSYDDTGADTETDTENSGTETSETKEITSDTETEAHSSATDTVTETGTTEDTDGPVTETSDAETSPDTTDMRGDGTETQKVPGKDRSNDGGILNDPLFVAAVCAVSAAASAGAVISLKHGRKNKDERS